jgi:hypothetical protein
MYLSKGEYSQFSLKGRLNLLQEFGTLINEKYVNEIKITLYLLYDFYVEVIYDNDSIVKAEPLKNEGMLHYYV